MDNQRKLAQVSKDLVDETLKIGRNILENLRSVRWYVGINSSQTMRRLFIVLLPITLPLWLVWNFTIYLSIVATYICMVIAAIVIWLVECIIFYWEELLYIPMAIICIFLEIGRWFKKMWSMP
jgi:hypothetical protein